MGRKLTPEEATALGLDGGTAKPPPAPAPPTPVAPPEPSIWQKFLDAGVDRLPDLGTMVGGAAGAVAGGPTPASLVLIPAGGAAGRGIGEMWKHNIRTAQGRPSPVPSVVDTAVAGAGDAMMQNTVGNVAGEIGAAYRQAQPLISEMAGKATPFANLSDPALGRVRAEAGKPAAQVMSAPRGDLAEKGAKFASPESAEAGQRGAQTLRRIAAPMAQDAEIGQAGARGRDLARTAEAELRATDDSLTVAKANALDRIRETLPQGGMTDASGNTGTRIPLSNAAFRAHEPGTTAVVRGADPTILPLPPGEKLVNKAFNEPDAVNSMMSEQARPARAAIADVKSIGLQQGALGDLRREGFLPAMRAHAAGVGPQAAEQAGADAGELEALARTIMRQRGGIQQQGPSGFLPRTLYETQKFLAGPRSTMAGFRPETPEAALQQNTPRLLEIEAMRRGLPPMDTASRSAAVSGLERPAMRALASPSGRALTGAEVDMLMRFLSGRDPNQ